MFIIGLPPWCPMIPLKSELLIFWECRHDTSHYDGGLMMFLRHLSATKHLHESVSLPLPLLYSVCCVSVAVRVFCLWFCSCHKVIKSMWHFYDNMTSRLKAKEATKNNKTTKMKHANCFCFHCSSSEAARQHRGTLREIWYQIKSKLKTIKIVSRLTLCLPLLCRLLVFSLISCEIEASEGNFKNSSRISLGICWGR